MASIDRIKAEAAAAQHERDTMAEQLKAALEQTRKMEIACQEWIAEVQREARLSMALSSTSPRAATAGTAPAATQSVGAVRAQSGAKSYIFVRVTFAPYIVSAWQHLKRCACVLNGQQSGHRLSLEPQLRCGLN